MERLKKLAKEPKPTFLRASAEPEKVVLPVSSWYCY